MCFPKILCEKKSQNSSLSFCFVFIFEEMFVSFLRKGGTCAVFPRIAVVSHNIWKYFWFSLNREKCNETKRIFLPKMRYTCLFICVWLLCSKTIKWMDIVHFFFRFCTFNETKVISRVIVQLLSFKSSWFVMFLF